MLSAAAIAVAAAVTACGGQDTTISAGQSTSPTSTATSPTPTSSPSDPTTSPTSSPGEAPAPGVVTYRGLQLTVPESWPRYDLAADPQRCVRFDQHAVFLGAAGASPSCPSRIIGRTEAVQVQPLSGATRSAEAAATAPATINGLAVRLDPDADTTGALTAVVTDLDLLVTVTVGDDRATADQILQSLHAI